MILQRLCLKPTYSLRWQLLLSFGSSTFLCMVATLLFSLLLSRKAGNLVQERAGSVMSQQVRDNLARSTRFTAETFTEYMSNIEGVAQIMAELALDRIVGYPQQGWEEDASVPFFDILSQRNVYPLKNDPLPLDWNITSNISPENANEMLQERESWASILGGFSSANTAAFFMRGSCAPGGDPKSNLAYMEGCSPEHNNVSTGGVFAPSPTTHGLYQKSGDIAAFWRPLYESHPDLLLMNMYFVNAGTGASINYPGYIYIHSGQGYESEGCDWMRNINPYTQKKYGTEAEIARCNPAGTRVIARDYNANERDWFQLMVAGGGEMVWYGPFQALGAPITMVSVGKAIYDRETNELIGVASVDLSTTRLNAAMRDLVPDNYTIIAVMDYETGALVANSEDTGVLENQFNNISDLGLGVHEDMLGHIRTGVDKIIQNGWTADSHSSLVYNCSFGVLSAFPIPVPPPEFDPEYRPQYVAIQVASDSIFSPVTDFEESIDQEIRDIAYLTTAIGIVGLVVTLAFVWFVARMFTEPLLWIGSVSKKILNHADKNSGPILDTDFKMTMWSPNTEIMDLVASFKKMIESFSGDRPPTVAVADYVEIRNSITWQTDFCQLYEKGFDAVIQARKGTSASTPVTEEESRAISDSKEEHGSDSRTRLGAVNAVGTGTPRLQSDFNENFQKDEMNGRVERPLHFVANSKAVDQNFDEKKKSISVVPAPPKQNPGRNIPVSNVPKTRFSAEGWVWVCRSKLFRWILLRLVTPLILATVAICVVVGFRIISTVPDWVDTLSEETLGLSRDAQASFVVLKSRLIEEMLVEPFRDVYLMSRAANWIHAGAIPLSGSFTESHYGTEECKSYDFYECPLFYDLDRLHCSCSWDDPLEIPGRVCTNRKSRAEDRSLQKRFYACQSKRTDPLTGDRFTGNGLVVDDTPNSTEWWEDVLQMPGARSNDTSQATTYSRAFTSSTFSTVEFPLYNYATELGRPKHHLGTFSAYEADGLFAGFQGCQYSFPNYALWKSSPENFAAEIRPTLCPLGEYGYDPRCRPWYQDTLEDFQTNNAFVHLTPPYPFSDEKIIGLSVASPILDPRSGNAPIGQVVLDFLPNGMWEAFESIDSPLSFMIATEMDSFQGDTIIGPDRSQGWSSARICDLLFPRDDKNSTFRSFFQEEFLTLMKEGQSDTKSFRRTTAEETVENFIMSFHPVYQRFVQPVDPGDITRGATVERKQIYSIGIASYSDEMEAAFAEVNNDVSRDLWRLAIIDIILTVVIASLFTAFAFRVSIHVTKPMIVLLKIVEDINHGKVDEEIPPLRGASREFSQVYTSFSKLNKVVGISNKAFFSGSLDLAYHFIDDALQLFRKVNDQKAIGIASNNLGNTIFAMAIRGQPPWMMNGRDGPTITIQTALAYYEEAIQICQRDFDEAQDNMVKVEHAQHLADRFFNRGLYYLFVAEEAEAPPEARANGLKDIAKARDLDYDVRDFFLEKKILFQHSDSYFWRLIRRSFGLSAHCTDAEVMEVWNVRTLVEDADSLLSAAWGEPSAPVFHDLGRVNRLQQLEAAALRLELCEGNTFEAARMAMRMLAEDEYIMACAFQVAASAILEATRTKGVLKWSPSTCFCLRSDFRAMSGVCRNVDLDLGKCVIFTLEVNECLEGGPLLGRVKTHCLRIFDKFCNGEDHVGVAAYTVRGDQTQGLGKKELHASTHRRMLDVATTSTSEMVCPSLPYAMQMIVDSAATLEKDTYVLLVTDGYSWDVEDYRAIKRHIEKLNQERRTWIHLLIVGLEIEDPEIVIECRSMCSITKASMFVEISLDTVDAAFASVVGTVNSLQLTEPSVVGITMEKF